MLQGRKTQLGVQIPEFLSWFGGYSTSETPDPIPNSEVKHCRADGTAA